MNSLVGFTGFVGSNLYRTGQFDRGYNSKNIYEAYGTCPDLLVYAGLRAEKYLANNNPISDYEQILVAEENIKRIKPKKLVLISTIDVFKKPFNVDENSAIETEGLNAYGYNRYLLECWVKKTVSDTLIVRLPGLFGDGIKKNFIFDIINVIPSMLNEEKFIELSGQEPKLHKFYRKQDNGFYKVEVNEDEKALLKAIFLNLNFSAINFTDSRSRFQFYNLENLWRDINIALVHGVELWHPATEPISARELYYYLTGKEFDNILPGMPANYNYTTLHYDLYGGDNGYISDKVFVMEQIKSFVLKKTDGGTE